MSVLMLDRMLDENEGLRETLFREGGIREKDIIFIKVRLFFCCLTKPLVAWSISRCVK